MTFYSVYIGDPSDVFYDPQCGETPVRKSPFFPRGSTPHYRFFKWADQTRRKVKQVDWAGYMIVSDKKELLDFMKYCYGEEPEYKEGERDGYGYLSKQFEDLTTFIWHLDPKKKYALVATEF